MEQTPDQSVTVDDLTLFDNLTTVNEHYVIVRTQAGFRKALRNYCRRWKKKNKYNWVSTAIPFAGVF